MTKILIIGKKGFIGSYLKEHLSKYFNVKNYSIDDILKSNFEENRLRQLIKG